MRSISRSKLLPDDATRTNERYGIWKHVIPLPPDSLMWSTGSQSIENFLVVADAWAQVVTLFVPEGSCVLDIGCGCGRTARVLINNRWIKKYIGFDILQENIDWCNIFVKPAWQGNAEFFWFDLYSAEYNPTGRIRASELRFPAADQSVDVVFAASLFTHLIEPDATHYLAEIGRILSARGRAILSIHNNTAPDTNFSGNETRIDIASNYFVSLAEKAGLTEVDRIDELGGQQVFIFRRRAVKKFARKWFVGWQRMISLRKWVVSLKADLITRIERA